MRILVLNFGITLVSVGFLLGILILVHEFGHFAAAKFFRVRVDIFSIGFGQRLLGFRRGDTDYRISAIPLGGYVKMAGENPTDEQTGDASEFVSHPRWQRLVIAISGPTMNICLAIILMTGVFMVHNAIPVFFDQPAVIGWVMEKSSADKAGFKPGDRIVKLEGMQNPTWEKVMPVIIMNANQPLDVGVQRGGEMLHLTLVPEAGPQQLGEVGWKEDEPNIITEIDSSMPAAKAGMKEGDVITALDNQPMRSLPAVIQYMQQTKGKTLDVTATRNGREMHFSVNPVLTDYEDAAGEKHYRIGIHSEPARISRLPLGAAFLKSVEFNRTNSLLIVELVKKMVQRKISIKQMDGPIGIARASGERVREKGWSPFLGLMAAISLNLGIFNLFPIPIMDGGVILLLLIEGAMRRDISLRLKERIYQAAFVFLVLFATLVIYNDIAKALPGWSKLLP